MIVTNSLNSTMISFCMQKSTQKRLHKDTWRLGVRHNCGQISKRAHSKERIGRAESSRQFVLSVRTAVG